MGLVDYGIDIAWNILGKDYEFLNKVVDAAEDVADVATDIGQSALDRTTFAYVGAYRAVETSGLMGARVQERRVRENEEVASTLWGFMIGTIKLSPVIQLIVSEIFKQLPEDVLNKIYLKLGEKAATKVARMAAISALKTVVAEKVAGTIQTAAQRWAQREIIVSGAMLKTGVGAPITVLNQYGLVSRAIWGAQELMIDYPDLYRRVAAINGQYFYFLIHPHVGDLVRLAGPRPMSEAERQQAKEKLLDLFLSSIER
ncbi:MAG: hypothetical protein AAGJ94_02280 [Pseudomonadota bacterium]